MKITKARLKEIIKEELTKMNEAVSGLSGDLDAERDMARGGLDRAIAARRQDRAINAPRSGLSPEAEEAIEGLKDMGIVAANGELGWNTVPDVAAGLAQMGVDAGVMGEVVEHFHALTR